jgi:serine protease AprX
VRNFPSLNPDAALVARGRADIRNKHGAVFERKATDRFCAAYAAAEADLNDDIEMVPGIVEFAPGDDGQVASAANAADLAVLLERAEGATEVQAAYDGLRQAMIGAIRDAFQVRMGGPRLQIERETARLASPRVRAAAPERALVQVGWLSGSILARTFQGVIDVASDPDVVEIDVPHRLSGEVSRISATLTAVRAMAVETSLTGRGVDIGLIDSEVAGAHPALAGRVAYSNNYTSEVWCRPALHGTAIAGIVAGADVGAFRGLAPEATIHNYKLFANHPRDHGTDFDAVMAIQRALEDGVRIVNCSWGTGAAGDGTSRTARACDQAASCGMTVVTSAGNSARSLSTPADSAGAIAVGAATADGTAMTLYSASGTAGGRSRPDLVAPGGTNEIPLRSTLPGGGIGAAGMGTSYAAAHVTGLLALLLEREPHLLPAAQLERLKAACVPLAGGTTERAGAGLIDPRRLLH